MTHFDSAQCDTKSDPHHRQAERSRSPTHHEKTNPVNPHNSDYLAVKCPIPLDPKSQSEQR